MSNLPQSVNGMFAIWENTAKAHDLVPCYFRFFDIQPGSTSMRAYVKEENVYKHKRIPTPTVIYSRVLDHLPAFRSHIQSLIKDQKIIFNVPNYDVEKYKIHEILQNDPYLRDHLPKTELFTIEALNNMASLYPRLFLKKSYGEFGEGAMTLEKVEKGQWCLSYKTKKNDSLKKIYFKKQIPTILKKRIKSKDYIIQEYLPLATYHHNPFDLRVAVQRNQDGKFQVSGVMCKVAKDQDYLTNGAQGGTTYSFNEVVKQAFPSIPINTLEKDINTFSVYVCNYLSDYFPHLADLGLDIGLTKEGKPYFIECNFISDYVSGIFENGEIIKQEWEAIFSTPIEYASYLINKAGSS